MQNYVERVPDTMPSLDHTEQAQPLSEEINGEMINNILSSVLPSCMNDETLVPHEQSGLIQNADGEIMFFTYTVNSTPPPVDELYTQSAHTTETSQKMILHVTDDGSTVMVPAECVGGFDVLGSNENGIMPQWTVNNLCSLVPDPSLTHSVDLNSNEKNFKENERLKQSSSTDTDDRRRTEQVRWTIILFF